MKVKTFFFVNHNTCGGLVKYEGVKRLPALFQCLLSSHMRGSIFFTSASLRSARFPPTREWCGWEWIGWSIFFNSTAIKKYSYRQKPVSRIPIGSKYWKRKMDSGVRRNEGYEVGRAACSLLPVHSSLPVHHSSFLTIHKVNKIPDNARYDVVENGEGGLFTVASSHFTAH